MDLMVEVMFVVFIDYRLLGLSDGRMDRPSV